MIDIIAFDENHISVKLEDVDVDSNAINTERDNTNTINTDNLQQIYTQSKQEIVNHFLSSIVLSQAKNMEIDLLHLLKASNTSLVLFGQIIYWVKRNEGNANQNGTNY